MFFLVLINGDEDCQETEREKSYAHLVKFSSKVAYGDESCSVSLHNPWLGELQDGFGVFLARKMDCGSMLTVECLPSNRVRHLSFVVSESLIGHSLRRYPIRFNSPVTRAKIGLRCLAVPFV